jgi:hypothetical protein
MVNPAPWIRAELTVTGVLPVELSFRFDVVATFTATLPKFTLVAFAVSSGSAAIPVPDNMTMVVAPVEELLLMESWPLATPAVVGSN